MEWCLSLENVIIENQKFRPRIIMTFMMSVQKRKLQIKTRKDFLMKQTNYYTLISVEVRRQLFG